MNAALLQEVTALPVADRLELLRALSDSLTAEDAPFADDVPLSHRVMLLERLADYHRNPNEGSPWQDVMARLTKR